MPWRLEMPRRTLIVLAFAMALALPGDRVEAQLDLGVHAAKAADLFDGVWGGGATIRLGLPLAPIHFLLGGDYFFPDCDDCSYMSGSADVRLSLPLPVVSPYALGGVTVRRFDRGDGAGEHSHSGPTVGAGVDLGAVVLGAYAELRYEFVDPEDQLVWRVGVRF